MPETPTVEIAEVIERAKQGQANAFLCRSSDGRNFYVKSVGATWRGLGCEWVSARLACEFGLPIAPFERVFIGDALGDLLSRMGNRHLVVGDAFGSQAVAGAREFDPALVPRCSPGFRRDLVIFDWWVRNADRTLGDHSGNPNLLWDVARKTPVVIDHNLAFDMGFQPTVFVQTHIFRADFSEVCQDPALRVFYTERLSRLCALLPTIWSELPHTWTHDEDGGERFAQQDFDTCLGRIHASDFWHCA